MGDMDSGNSGSLQSSSGGDDDYESSRGPAAVDSFSSFFTPPAPPVTLGSFLPSNHHLPSQPPPPQSYFDPLATYFDHLSRSSNPDPVWPKDARPGPNSMPPSTSDHLNPSSSAAGKQGRNPRKRTRASRRAPTTVLTTDTSNFRAMVQEFTGIPSPPFGSSAASPSSLLFPRTRFDLFGNPRGGDAPPYLLRPLAQKLPIPPQQPNKNSSGDVMYPDLLFKYPDAGPGSGPGPSKPGPASGGGSLELPITIRPSNNNGSDQLGGITAGFVTASDGVSGSGGKSNGNGGPLVWAEGLGLGADAGAGGPSHHQPHNLGFAHQHIG